MNREAKNSVRRSISLPVDAADYVDRHAVVLGRKSHQLANWSAFIRGLIYAHIANGGMAALETEEAAVEADHLSETIRCPKPKRSV